MRFRPIILILLFVLVASNSCKNRKPDPECFPGNSQQVGTFPITKSKFLPVIFFENPDRLGQLDKSYSSRMNGLHEPSLLSDAENSEEVYRFVWMRSFHNLICLRIQKSSGSIAMIIKEANGTGGDETGTLKVDRTKQLSADEWNRFESLLATECFWRLDTSKDEGGIDGATWLLEGKKSNRYHLAWQWSPQNKGFRAACLYLLELSDLNIRQDEIY